MRTLHELRLPYFKKGDDLHHAMTVADKEAKPGGTQAERNAHACLIHASALEHSAKMLKDLGKAILEKGVLIENADTHLIQVSCDKEVGEELVKQELLREPWEDEELEDEDEDEDLEDLEPPLL